MDDALVRQKKWTNLTKRRRPLGIFRAASRKAETFGRRLTDRSRSGIEMDD